MARRKFVYVFGLLQTMFGLCSNAQRIYGDPNYPFVHNATEAPLVLRNYDYIIVGGGTAGCPLAATLSQNFTVLLLERGGSPYSNQMVENLVGFYPNLQINTPTSASQQFTSEDGVLNNRARVLGGGSAINAGFFTYADPQFVADAGWDVALVNASFAWVADEVAQLPTPGVFQSAARDALLEAGVTPYNGQTYEHLVGTKVGGSLFDSNGHRHTAADLLSYANPDNIDVYLYATAQQLLFATEGPRVVGVAYTDLEGGNHTAFLRDSDARSEVIVAAGALGSPQLLMLSGVGPADHLAEFNITTVVENPAVGSQMADNPTNSLWVLTSEEVEVALIQVVGITSFGSYIEVSSGQAEALLGVLREDESKVYERRVTAQVLQSRIIGAILGTPRGPLRARAAWGGTVLQKIWGPQSRGLLRLASLDAGENPRVRFNYFQEEADLATCERGVRLAMDAVTAPALARLQYTNDSVPLFLRPVRDAVLASWPQRDASNATQDSINLRDWCLDSVITIWHYHGGCLVGEVVDPDYRVMGVQALRVIDGSTFRQSPGTNPQATVMMLGRYMGVQILRDRLPGSYTAN